VAAGTYTWLTADTAVQQLAQRLADPNMQFWVYNELLTYITRALQQFNSLTWMWRKDFTFVNAGPNVWSNLGSITNSPRQRTITDLQVYAELEYMLLEPSNTLGTWTGTTQFTISDLSQALQRRRDEMIQVSNCNQVLLSQIPLTPGTRRTQLPDSTIDVERVRYLQTVTPGLGYGQGGYGQGGYGGGAASYIATTLVRDDTIANEFYEVPLWQFQESTPQTFALSAQPPLSFDVDYPPALPGTYEAVVLQSGAPFNPPTATLVGLPDDWIWILEYGALADLLGSESEKTDHERADFCMRRYQDGLKLIQKTPWIELGKVNGVAVSCDSIVDLDRFDPEWDSNPTGFGPVIVAGGIDFLASPVGASCGVTCLANAPVPVNPGDFLQVSRSDWEIVISLAQVRAAWKMGGAEFKAALAMEKEAITACAAENVRLKSQGCFSDILTQRGGQQERDAQRYNNRQKV
jgi:hypothetical protein